jgi:hypothetical protein
MLTLESIAPYLHSSIFGQDYPDFTVHTVASQDRNFRVQFYWVSDELQKNLEPVVDWVYDSVRHLRSSFLAKQFLETRIRYALQILNFLQVIYKAPKDGLWIWKTNNYLLDIKEPGERYDGRPGWHKITTP